MKIKLCFIFIILAAVTGCVGTAKPQTPQTPQIPQQQEYGLLEVQPPPSPEKLKLVDIKTPVKQGEEGSITVQGQPDTVYSITSTFLVGRDMVTSYEHKTSSLNGTVTWRWRVRTNTAPGSYPVTITGGGRTLKTTYTVIQ